ncbi:MAG: hypothetical protein EZS28_006603 [Streblomastix strix]|uniref:Uncharacterized protein n=1 Tax=Streblomastix strix TaxID=222440 RepID=A0A5J4WRW8_9EUKA|nr:MAG: hypothetical protein EZS28_006603 [Streblomastix strix]
MLIGYYLLNTDIQQLENSANGDFAFSAESGTVCMYDQNLYDSGDIVPNQVTPASEATPLVDSGTGDAGNSNEYSRGDNKHPLQVSDVLPAKDTATCEEGTANTYARIDHTHHVNLSNGVPKKDSGTGTAGTANIYSSATNQHPLNVDPTTANVPLVNATAAANGTSDYYCRNDHLHPQQLTYDGNLTAIKFIKSGGLATEVLCTNGDTTTLDNKLSTTYSSGAGGYIRLYVFPAGNSTVYGIFTAPTKVSITAIYLAYIRLESVGSIRIVVTDQSTFSPTRITEILSQDVVTTVSSGIQVRINYNYRYGGIMQNTLQVNPTVQIKACSNTAISGTVADQWEISKNNDDALTIVSSSLRQTDHSVSLNVGTDYTITSRKSFKNDQFQIQPAATSYDDGLRIAGSDSNTGNATIQLGYSRISNTGGIEGFAIAVASQAGDNTRGLKINADGNTLTFNGKVLRNSQSYPKSSIF